MLKLSSNSKTAARITGLALSVFGFVAEFPSAMAASTTGQPSFATLRSMGMKCDGRSDDSAAFAAALAQPQAHLGGEGRTCAVRGAFVLQSNTILRNVTLKQLNGSATSTLTTPGAAGGVTPIVSNVTLSDVTIDRNGSPDGGDSTKAALHLINILDFDLKNVEVFGDGLGVGILIGGNVRGGPGQCRNIRLVKPYVHDMRWSQDHDPHREIMEGIRIAQCNGVVVTGVRINRLLGRVVVGPYTQLNGTAIPTNVFIPYQIHCIAVSQSTNVRFEGGDVSNCATGSDVSGSGTNRDIWFIRMRYSDIGDFGQKWVHTVLDSGSIDCVVKNAGLSSYVIADGGPADVGGPVNIALTRPISINPGAPYDWGSGRGQLWNTTHIGFTAQHLSSGHPMRNVSVHDGTFVDTQSPHTMTYGISFDAPGMDVTLTGPKISGARFGNFHNYAPAKANP